MKDFERLRLFFHDNSYGITCSYLLLQVKYKKIDIDVYRVNYMSGNL